MHSSKDRMKTLWHVLVEINNMISKQNEKQGSIFLMWRNPMSWTGF